VIDPDDPKFAMPAHTITEQQGAAIWDAVRVWSAVYLAEKGEPPAFTTANLQKSCLLGRILYEGKPPLPLAPPTALAAPWYKLVEDGIAYLHGTRFHDFRIVHEGSPSFFDGAPIVGIHGCPWRLVATPADRTYEVEHPGAPGRWIIRPVRDDEKVQGGREAQPDGTWTPIYYDYALERIE
jgi:hypothetical protein